MFGLELLDQKEIVKEIFIDFYIPSFPFSEVSWVRGYAYDTIHSCHAEHRQPAYEKEPRETNLRHWLTLV